MLGLLGKSKGQTIRIAAVLHALFGVDDQYISSPDISDAAVMAALNMVKVCNEHTKTIAGRLSFTPSTAIMACKNNQY